MGLFTKTPCSKCGDEFRKSKLHSNGLCERCYFIGENSTYEYNRAATDSFEIIRKSKNIDTILGRYDYIIDSPETHLKPWDDYGFNSLTSSEIAKILEKEKDELIIEHLNLEFEKAKEKSLIAQTLASKTNPILKLIPKVKELLPYSTFNKDEIEKFRLFVDHAVNRIKLDDFLTKAKKSEFKGNKNKALDNYYEALFLLRNDNIDDSKQSQEISELESKIKSLGGEIKV